ncbi:helix-turn-helix transcriptional regulator [Deinococcus sp. S9]|uniref:helix-turn-helix domain-containing protein n=1 Tax=Deinococcus sp. S9 TaxID=2545754 RepID=UPI001055A0E7|nr:helix-turn-helix transcriptional regulator [Deinococcus sp. S9]TDE84825.1 XRE family transcriptional regulator [Deinococcus sp. S9]
MKVHELEQLLVQRLHAYPPKDPTLGQLARALGVTQPFLRQIGWGKRPIPRRLLDPLAEQLGLTYDVTVVEVSTGRPVSAPSASESGQTPGEPHS